MGCESHSLGEGQILTAQREAAGEGGWSRGAERPTQGPRPPDRAPPLPAELAMGPRLAPALHYLENNLQPPRGLSSDPRLAESVGFAWCLLAAQTPGGDGRQGVGTPEATGNHSDGFPTADFKGIPGRALAAMTFTG